MDASKVLLRLKAMRDDRERAAVQWEARALRSRDRNDRRSFRIQRNMARAEKETLDAVIEALARPGGAS